GRDHRRTQEPALSGGSGAQGVALSRLQRAITTGTLAGGESIGQSLPSQEGRGKSGLHRAECQVTPGRREPTASATENNRLSASAPVRVKRCGKSAPHGWQQSVAR